MGTDAAARCASGDSRTAGQPGPRRRAPFVGMTLAERMESRTAMIPFHECWEWVASGDSDGYGQLMVGKRMKKAHRVAWELANGPIPDGSFVCHHCDNPSCVRPSHLFLGSNSENMRDMVRKGRLNGGIERLRLRNQALQLKTHCPRGHEYAGANLRIALSRNVPCRHCLACQSIRNRVRRAARIVRVCELRGCAQCDECRDARAQVNAALAEASR